MRILAKKWGWVGVWLMVGMGMRAYNLPASPFGFDQVQILTQAENIRGGDWTLIGPRTGPAALFTGPLIYYLVAGLGMVIDPIKALGVLAVGLAVVTGATLYILSRKYLDYNWADWLLPVWALSPFLISLDRVTWNPNLMVLSAALVLLPSLSLGRWRYGDVLTIGLGVWLSYQAHFSGFLLLPLAYLGMILNYRRERWPVSWFLLPGLAWGLSIAPTFIFDLKHDFLNWRGLTQLLTNSDQVSLYMMTGRLSQTLFVIAESMGKIWWYQNQTLWITVAGTAGLGVGFWIFAKRSRQQAVLMGGWLAVLAVALALYRESTPEYYFLLGMPIWILLWSAILAVWVKANRVLVGVALALYAGMMTHQLYAPEKMTGLALGSQQAVVAEMVYLVTTIDTAKISWDIEPADAIGLKYLWEKEGLQTADEGADLHVIYPLKATDYFSRRPAPMVGLWVEVGDKLSSTAIPLYPFLIYIPSNLVILEEYSREAGVDRQWRVEDERGEHIATLQLINRLGILEKEAWDKTQWRPETVDGWLAGRDKTSYKRRFEEAQLELIPRGSARPAIKVRVPGTLEYILDP